MNKNACLPQSPLIQHSKIFLNLCQPEIQKWYLWFSLHFRNGISLWFDLHFFYYFFFSEPYTYIFGSLFQSVLCFCFFLICQNHSLIKKINALLHLLQKYSVQPVNSLNVVFMMLKVQFCNLKFMNCLKLYSFMFFLENILYIINIKTKFYMAFISSF